MNLTCRVGLTRKTAFMGVVFQKAVTLNSSAATLNLGSLINVIGNDAEKMSLASRLFQNAWFQPVALILCMSLLVHYIGNSAFVGFGMMLILLPCQILLAKKLTTLRRILLSKGDARISVVSNLVEGIRAIKLLTWESFILSDIALKRRTELRSLRQFLLLNLLNYMLLTSIPIFVAALTFWVYIAAGNELTASTAFTALSLLNMLRGPLFMFPRVLSAVLDGYVGIERAQSLLNTEECQRDPFVHEADENKVGISVVNQSFDWKRIPVINLNRTSSSTKNNKKEEEQQHVAAAAEEKEIETESSAESSNAEVTAEQDEKSSAPSLVTINMTLKKSQLGIVLGSVGSGKSTLLSSLLGECPSVSTTTQHVTTKMITGSVAYVSQLPFIAQTTVRENILFGQSYDSEFYETCLEVCALKDDIARFPSGDATEIGERGINLSGGQKMRVALARAMYSQAQVYLLDDPLAGEKF